MNYYPKMIGTLCFLSPINTEDAPQYTRWLNDLEVTKNLTLHSMMIYEEGEREVLQTLAKDHNYGIIAKDTEKLIGNCGLLQLDHKNRTAETGIFIGDKEYWGKGYGTEALQLLLEYSFDYLNMRNIFLRVYSFNERAMASYQKIGFKEIGSRRKCIQLEGKEYDEVYFDILNDEFKPAIRSNG